LISLESLECSLCKLCVDACEPGAIKLSPVLDSFVVSIESCGSMPVKDLVAKAALEIKKRAEDLNAKLAELA
jgi:DNA-directed RNA polymerase subunit D